MIEAIVEWSVRHRRAVLLTSLLLASSAAYYASRLELDALPDVTGNLVVVLTNAPGFNPEEVEKLVTRPVEISLGGIPGVAGQRSISRYGISSVTVEFEDDVDPFLARQLVQERLNTLQGTLPDGAEPPELGPYTGGLGEVFQFTLSSPRRTPTELYEIAELQVAPLLRTVPGVVEVNTWGGARRTLDVVVDPVRLAQYELTLSEVADSVASSIGTAPGDALRSGPGQRFLRGVSLPSDATGLENLVVRSPEHKEHPIRLSRIARVVPGYLPRTGSATSDGRGEVVYVMVQMLRGGNAQKIMSAVTERMPQVRATLPQDVVLRTVYDRTKLVGQTMRTVFTNLLEGGLLVIFVLFAMLGSYRAGVLVAVSIPLSMLGATTGMVLLGIPGNLMSLGAIDFGLLVDGAVVMVESLFHEAPNDPERFTESVANTSRRVARPVFFSVLIILLVYVPIVSLDGVDGKMFRPMAMTVILALTTSLLLVLTFVPAASATFLRPRDVPRREPRVVAAMRRAYRPTLRWSMAHPAAVLVLAVVMLGAGLFLFARAGTDFVPQLDEGDVVVQTTREADVSVATAVRGAGRFETALLEEVPEVEQVASRIGSPAVATDIMGLEQADVFVALKPREAWRPGVTKAQIIAEMNRVIAERDPGSNPAFTQPIQMRFNELVGGETSDVALSIHGPDLVELRRLAVEVEAQLEAQPGAVDVRITAPPEVPLIEVEPNALASAQAGLGAGEVLQVVQAIRTGVDVAITYDGLVRIPVRVLLDVPPTKEGLDALRVPVPGGDALPLAALADVRERLVPAMVSHEDAQRRIVIGFNVRDRSLGDVVGEAKQRVTDAVPLPAGYHYTWGGQYETLQHAQRRMLVVVPLALLSVLGLLVWTFRRFAPALIILTNVPFAGVGGMVALATRDMSVSISAAVGFIALSGIAVLNGVVLMNELLALERAGHRPAEAAHRAAISRMRPVMMTALVAALGFLPMMLATGVGAEVQRPLATVVVGGLVTSTVLTLLILPSLYGWIRSRSAS